MFSGADVSNSGRESPKEHFRGIIFKLGHWPMRRCRLNVFLFVVLVAILFSGAGPLLPFWYRVTKNHFHVIILKWGNWSRGRCHLKVYSNFSSGSHFVYWCGIILAILVEGYQRNSCVKSLNQVIGLRVNVVHIVQRVYGCFATLQFATYTCSLSIRVLYQRFHHPYTFATRHRICHSELGKDT